MKTGFEDFEYEKNSRAKNFNKRDKTKYKKRHIGDGQKLREEIEVEEDPILEYYQMMNS